MDQIARDGTMLASDLNSIEDEIKEGFVRVKMVAKEVKEEKAVRKDEVGMCVCVCVCVLSMEGVCLGGGVCVCTHSLVSTHMDE